MYEYDQLYSFDTYKGVKIFIQLFEQQYYAYGYENGTCLCEGSGYNPEKLLEEIKLEIDKEKQMRHFVEDDYYTKNGEITFNKKTNLYTVWDETYAYTVGTTQYPKVAEAMLEAYIKYYLEGENK